MTLLKRILPFLLLLAILAPATAFAAPLHMTAANAPTVAAAPANGGLSIDLNGSGLFTDRMLQIVALITVLSIAPSIIIMMTSFVRIVVVLSLLRTALGLQQSPPNSVIVSLAMFLTLFIMSPTLTDAYHAGIQPMMANQVTTEQGFTAALVPMKKFMLAHVRDADLKLFSDMAKAKPTNDPAQVAVTTLAPAFMLSELKTRLRDRLPDLRAVFDHRHGGRLDPDEHGHDDAAAGDHLAALQADFLCPGGWLAADRRLAGAELSA